MKGKMTSLTINKFRSAIFAMSFVIAFITSCSEREQYYEFQELKDGKWAVGQSIDFEIDTLGVEKNVPYDVSIEITNDIQYPYQNLWLFFEYIKDDSTTIKNEKEFILVNKSGRWNGAGFATLFHTSHIVMESVIFDEDKTYLIHIRHGMKDEVLDGIERVGIKIAKAK